MYFIEYSWHVLVYMLWSVAGMICFKLNVMHFKHPQELISELQTTTQTICDTQTSQVEMLSSKVSKTREDLTNFKTDAHQTQSHMQQNLLQQKAGVDAYVDEEILKDQPTGKTPRRKEMPVNRLVSSIINVDQQLDFRKKHTKDTYESEESLGYNSNSGSIGNIHAAYSSNGPSYNEPSKTTKSCNASQESLEDSLEKPV